MWFLFRVALVALCLFAIVDGASHPAVVVIIGAPALVIMLMLRRPALDLARFAVALLLLWLWAYIVWHYVWFPSYAVLVRPFCGGSSSMQRK